MSVNGAMILPIEAKAFLCHNNPFRTAHYDVTKFIFCHFFCLNKSTNCNFIQLRFLQCKFTENGLILIISVLYKRAPKTTSFDVFEKLKKYFAQNKWLFHPCLKKIKQKEFKIVYMVSPP